METEDTQIEIDAPPSLPILVIQGQKMTVDQILHIRDRLKEAIANDDWPFIIAGCNGPVYWVGVGAPAEVPSGAASSL